MAQTVVEQLESRAISNSGGAFQGTRVFAVWNDTNPITQPSMISLGSDGLPAYGDQFPGEDLWASTWSFEPIPDASYSWRVTWNYTPGDDGTPQGPPDRPQVTPSQIGWVQQSFEFGGAFKDAWRADPSLVLWGSVATPTSDIGGTKVDAAGEPVSVFVPQLRIVFEETVTGTSLRGQTSKIAAYVGSRNSSTFRSCSTGTVLYEGASARRVGPNAYTVAHRFLVDEWQHAIQVPRKNTQRNVDVDLYSGFLHANVVRWVQPFPSMVNLYNISSNF